MTIPTIRMLTEGDEGALRAFLEPCVASSMFLLGNMLEAGLRDHGRRLEGTYVAAFEGPSLVGVAAHYWNRYLVMQAPASAVEVCRAAVLASGRVLGGLIGPAQQVEQVGASFGIDPATVQIDEIEHLYTLDLADLQVPSALAEGQLRARRAEKRDLDTLAGWRVGYNAELLHEPDDASQRNRSRTAVERMIEEGSAWVLEDLAGTLLSQSGFNAQFRHAVQVGGVYTPPNLRGRGYARAIVAGSLLHMRDDGARLGVLYTGVDNHAAQRAYESIRFQRTGDYRVLLLRTPLDPANIPR